MRRVQPPRDRKTSSKVRFAERLDSTACSEIARPRAQLVSLSAALPAASNSQDAALGKGDDFDPHDVLVFSQAASDDHNPLDELASPTAAHPHADARFASEEKDALATSQVWCHAAATGKRQKKKKKDEARLAPKELAADADGGPFPVVPEEEPHERHVPTQDCSNNRFRVQHQKAKDMHAPARIASAPVHDENDEPEPASVDPLKEYRPLLEEIAKRELPVDLFLQEGAEMTSDLEFLLKLASTAGSSWTNVPPSARNYLITAVRPLLQTLLGALRSNDENLVHESLMAFFAFPQFTLTKHSGSPNSRSIRGNLMKIIEGAAPNPQALGNASAGKQEREESDFLTPKQREAVKTAVRLVQQGFLKRALQTLERCDQQGILDPTPDTIAKMISLHPKPTWESLPGVPEHAPTGLALANSTFKKGIKAITNGSAPDWAGWTGELISVLARDDDCREALKELTCRIRDNALPERARDNMLASWLIVLPKADNGCRPIAGGTVLVKLAVSCGMITCDKAVKALFEEQGLQFGIGFPDGCLTATRLTQLVLEADPNTSRSNWTSRTPSTPPQGAPSSSSSSLTPR